MPKKGEAPLTAVGKKALAQIVKWGFIFEDKLHKKTQKALLARGLIKRDFVYSGSTKRAAFTPTKWGSDYVYLEEIEDSL